MEINDALVTAITRELLKRLNGGGNLPSGEKKPLVIAGDSSGLSSGTLASIEGCYDIARSSGLEAAFPDKAEVLIAKLGIQALTRVAEGDAGCTPEGTALLWALLRGKKPVIVEEGIEWRSFKDTVSPTLAAKYISYERTLASYGAVIVPESGVAKMLSCCCGSQPAKPAAAPKVYGVPSNASAISTGGKRRIISEVDIIRLCPAAAGQGQTVEIGSRDILTPLAEDYISKMRITVNRIG
jgi:ethanolamine utilization protein